MDTRTTDLSRALRLSVLSIAWSGVAGSIAVYAALVSGSLSLLGFGADAVIDSVASVVLVWRFRVEARQPHRAERVEAAAERVVGIALIALALYLAFGAATRVDVGDPSRDLHREPRTVARLGGRPAASCRGRSTAWPLGLGAAPCGRTAS